MDFRNSPKKKKFRINLFSPPLLVILSLFSFPPALFFFFFFFFFLLVSELLVLSSLLGSRSRARDTQLLRVCVYCMRGYM
ncbi:hypothetical protein K445DRAFT_172688 [Daldinia sp. EC12]|nr:hypothetical protein K445DRAFT_172688 [Daldinia sp. EC12]